MKNQRGFTVVVGLLIVIAVTLVGLTGMYIYNSNKKVDEANAGKSKIEDTDPGKTNTTKTETDLTADWKTFSSSDGKFSLKYPTSWLQPANTDMCEGLSFLAGTSEDSRGACRSDGAAQIQVVMNEGDQTALYVPHADGRRDIQIADITVDGVQGKRYTSTSEGDIFIEKGTKFIEYVLYSKGRTFVAIYSDGAGKYKNAEPDFTLMVTKTLKLTP